MELRRLHPQSRPWLGPTGLLLKPERGGGQTQWLATGVGSVP